MGTKVNALVIDDDARLAAMVAEYLGKNEVDVTVAGDGERGLKALASGPFDVILLDIMLPGVDGLEVCKQIRSRPEHAHIPIVMLTAKGDDVDKIVGLELGADDYLAKPFNPRELLARLRAVLRRSGGQQSPQSRPGDRVKIGELEIDFSSREVSLSAKRLVLTHFEFELLACLAKSAGRVLSREHLLDALKGAEFESFDRSIDVHISKLRGKLERDPKAPRYIKTVRGVGYVLVRNVEAEGEPGADGEGD